ncbi:MAG: molecular chaperone HtpG [Clostridiales bacterium]|nr:molecular chaperone HtpG [Candidatus Equinaster intestinalis]
MAKKHFKAESKRLLDLMINSIYTNREIFLREIISNSSDALDKLHYISLTDEAARKSIEGELAVHITADKENRTITVSDNGIGMSAEELESNLGTICKSGSLAFKDGIPENDAEAANIIGQFGVGFYSAFMVADKVTVESRKYDSEASYRWESDGAEGYTIAECEKSGVGTRVIMHLKEDTENERYSDFLEEYRLKNLIKTYSDYIRYPIKMEVTKYKTVGEGEDAKQESYTEEDTLNSMIPLWKKQKAEVTKEETDAFYKDNFFDSTEPAATIQISTEGLVSYKALLFVPSAAPYNYFTKDYKKGLKLYSSGVMIMESCEDLLPDHFRFVKGVVESDDLSLNISREMLQQDHQLKTIATNIEKKIKTELKKLLENDREKYEKFFTAFGIQLKYGVTADYGMHAADIKDLLIFYSMNEKKMITISEYLQKMPEDQKHIYYACGESVNKIISLPQTELVKEKGYDMLCLTDEVDEFVMQVLPPENEKDFCSINSEKADLAADEKQTEELEKENKELLEYLKENIEGVKNVIISKKLKSHPVCLSTEGGITLEMEKYFASIPSSEMKPKAERVLEINADHEIFATLKEIYGEDKEKAARLGEVLYCQALLIADMPLENPARYTDLLCEFIK